MLKLFDSSLRLCAVPLSVATIWVTVTNQQDNSSYGMLKYYKFSALKYMVLVSTLCACYALVAAACSWIRYYASKAWIFFVSDQDLLAYLLRYLQLMLLTDYGIFNDHSSCCSN
ncbi:CASP-like protein 2D1 isoform X2 [Vigna radiata var. radiata]|uniref:CASP-like protein n=1 Tax=Vigna radiata var. radiata TaxID=3916 RepID=A0A3Q0EQF2_VIGRR|nr:CASP-like protein 2D1 isoform X2 [Vigna radiata var. radiata]